MRTLALLALAVFAASCGPGRTTAATQPTPAAFDPAASDPAALAIVDASLDALGGYKAWEGAKQLTWSMQYTMDGAVKGQYRHAWDRWNGRHNYQTADLPAAAGDPAKAPWMKVYYDQFDPEAKVHASYDGKAVGREDAARFKAEAVKHLADDGYMLFLVYKVRDPGVHLAVDGDVPQSADGTCAGGCTRVKVTFDPAVGKDTWFVDYSKTSKLPEMIEQQRTGGNIAFRIDGWNKAGGLQLPARLQNMGLAGEVFEVSDLAVGDPDDSLYMPSITGAGGE